MRRRPARRHRQVTGHSYIVYDPLVNHTTGSSTGAPDWPDIDRLWQIVEKYKATILCTPRRLAAFMQRGTEFPISMTCPRRTRHGRRADQPRAGRYWKVIGGERCPVVDTGRQTETGSTQHTARSRRSLPATFRPGIVADVYDERTLSGSAWRYLVLKRCGRHV
jgi:acetyl-CoA synthetase